MTPVSFPTLSHLYPVADAFSISMCGCIGSRLRLLSQGNWKYFGTCCA